MENEPVSNDSNQIGNLHEENITETGNGMYEALLVEEYPNMSAAMKNLLSSLESPTTQEVLVSLLYIMVIETGFVPFSSNHLLGDEHDCPTFNIKRLRALNFEPKTWVDGDGVFRVYFKLAAFPVKKCKLVCLPIGVSLIVNMYSTCNFKSFAMVINPLEYVTLYPNQITFKKLKQLSINFKDNIVIPNRTIILNEMLQTNVGLFALPYEILLKIISYLPVHGFLKWSSACKYFFYTFSQNEDIWKHFCHLKFGRTVILCANDSYRRYYCRKINIRNQISSLTLNRYTIFET